MSAVYPPTPVDPEALRRALAEAVGEDGYSLALVDRVAASRDYWPPATLWMLEGRLVALPAAVVWPRTVDEVAAVLRTCAALGVPVTPFGEGSGAVGGAVPVRGGVVLDTKRMNAVRRVDRSNLLVEVEAGCNGERLERRLGAERLTLGHVPQSLRCSTVGGWISCRAAGQASTRYGKIEDIVVALEGVLPTGEPFRSPLAPRTATGPRIDHLLVGAEGTLGVITAAHLRVWPLPETRYLQSWVFDNEERGLEAVRRTLQAGGRPAVVRLYDHFESSRHFGRKGWVLVTVVEGDPLLAEAEARLLKGNCESQKGWSLGEGPVRTWMVHRFDVSLASPLFRQGAVLDTIEVACLWDRAQDMYREMVGALGEVAGTALASGHFSHFYPEGACLYVTVVGFPGEDRSSYHARAWEAAMEACLGVGGSIGHHHGAGLQRVPWLEREHGALHGALGRVRRALDPAGIMNPGKLGV